MNGGLNTAARDARLSQIAKAEEYRRKCMDGDGEMDVDEIVEVSVSPDQDDFCFLSGHAVARRGCEVFWDFEADCDPKAIPGMEDPDEELVRMFEAGIPAVIGRMARG